MSITLSDFKSKFYDKLSMLYDKQEIGAMYRLFIEYFLGMDSIQQALKPQLAINGSDLQELDQALEKLVKSEPIQYIIGESYFFDLTFKVREGILIPRQETEILVQSVLNKVRDRSRGIKILDIGTGSGCIAISLQKNIEGSSVIAIDISDKAIETAKENARLNNSEVQFIKMDILDTNCGFNDHFDVIVSNPPYVLQSEKELMHKNVVDFEPGLALYVNDDNPFIYYERIISFCITHLKNKGILAFEINEKYGENIKKMMEKNGFTQVEVVQDLNYKDRVLIGYFR